MNGIGSLVWNPIIAREARTRMRSKRTAFILFCWLAALGVVTILAYASAANQSASVAVLAHSGVTVFGALVAVIVALVLLLVPGLVAGSIAGERERQTLDLLLCTRVRPWRVVIGKLAASLAFMGFLLVASLPILSVVALLGGIAWGDILIVVGLGALTAVMIGSMSILFSAISKGPTGAIVCSYVAMFILLVGPLVLGSYLLAQGFASGVSGSGFSSSSGGGLIAGPPTVSQASAAPPLIMALSPGLAIGSEVASISSQNCATGGFTTIGGGFSSPAVYNCGVVTFDRIDSGPLNGWHIWQVFTVFAIALSALCIGLAIVALRGRVPWPRRAQPEGT
ncbi:MAG TPA: ABC transporter permease [Candidatus Saccharimonadales bacterium]|nr:ABC transporter permease [Candidatus Saccharimonadales bacterium]